ncbi:MAG: HD domain-containing protein [Bdellovibrionales bacterium]|nr:HD domain-containing protein [Bdellovibrionales bacterium]
MSNSPDLLAPSPTVNFADVAHQTLIFNSNDPAARLVLDLIDTPWVQRLRRVRQTGNTHLVYMFAEHSRFGHSLGVAYLALQLMDRLERFSAEAVRPYRSAVAAAALLHDIGHVAPGSHLATRIWSPNGGDHHEDISARIVREDPTIATILQNVSPQLAGDVTSILTESGNLPAWTYAVISGGGWNADRGNWTIVDSAMCSVNYGRYNVAALVDAFRLSSDGRLILQESRVDALTHFFVARDSMYRQVYQHRVLQAADSLTERLLLRIRDILNGAGCGGHDTRSWLAQHRVFADETLLRVLSSGAYGVDLAIDDLFRMTEDWWAYLVSQWCDSADPVLSDLAQRLRDRRLFKTIRLIEDSERSAEFSADNAKLVAAAEAEARELGFDPRYYVILIDNRDQHRDRREAAPAVLRDDGSLVDVRSVEPIIDSLSSRAQQSRIWLAVPKEVKARLGRSR